MKKENDYPKIDLAMTGLHLKQMAERKGCTVKDIQRQLHLACPQPVYRWFKGQILPSVDHLYALSRMFHVHMEDLLLTAEPETDLREALSFSMEQRKHMHLIFYGTFRRPETAPDSPLAESEGCADCGFRGISG